VVGRSAVLGVAGVYVVGADRLVCIAGLIHLAGVVDSFVGVDLDRGINSRMTDVRRTGVVEGLVDGGRWVHWGSRSGAERVPNCVKLLKSLGFDDDAVGQSDSEIERTRQAYVWWRCKTG